MKKSVFIGVLSVLLLSSCVSKKKYVALETDLAETKSVLSKTQLEKEGLENKVSKIEARVTEYNNKINSLKEVNDSQYSSVDDVVVMSNNNKEKMRATLAKLKNSIADEEDDINVDIDKTVVMINISDKLLFNSGSYTVSEKANTILEKLAGVINSEPSMEVMVEGHTDSKTINTVMLQDNWDLSVKRATSITRILQKKYNVNPSKLIAAGRSSYVPLVDNETDENRSKNRRTRIVIIPNLDKFFALLDAETL